MFQCFKIKKTSGRTGRLVSISTAQSLNTDLAITLERKSAALSYPNQSYVQYYSLSEEIKVPASRLPPAVIITHIDIIDD